MNCSGAVDITIINGIKNICTMQILKLKIVSLMLMFLQYFIFLVEPIFLKRSTLAVYSILNFNMLEIRISNFKEIY